MHVGRVFNLNVFLVDIMVKPKRVYTETDKDNK